MREFYGQEPWRHKGFPHFSATYFAFRRVLHSEGLPPPQIPPDHPQTNSGARSSGCRMAGVLAVAGASRGSTRAAAGPAATPFGNGRRALIGMSYKGPSAGEYTGKPVTLSIDRYW